MTLDDFIIKTVSSVVKPVVPNLYTGESVRYCTFNYSELPDGLGDNCAALTRALVQVHYFAPLRESTVKTRHALRDAIAAVDEFTLPSIEPATDETGQHYVLEFDAVGRWEAEDDGQS